MITAEEVEVYRPPPDLRSWFADPRPELKADSDLWRHLLVAAFRRDPELGMALFLFRSMGSRLEWTGRGRAVRPGTIDPTGRRGWTDEGEYQNLAQSRLAPKTTLLKELLLALRQDGKGRLAS